MHGQKKGWTLWSWCIFNWMLMGSVSERRLVLINQGGVQKKDSVLKPSSNLAIGGYRGKRCQMPWVLLMKKKTHWQFSGTARFVKNADFVCCYGEIIRRPAAASILMPPTFHIARLNCYTPNFSGVGQKLTWCQQFGLQIFPKWGDADIFRLEMAVFRCFFGRNKFSRPNGRLSPIACHTYLESYGT